MSSKVLERPNCNGFAIAGLNFQLGYLPICTVYDQKTGAEIDQVFYINCETGEYGCYAEGPGGERPYVEEGTNEVRKEWAFGELRVVFDEDPPAPLLREMTIPM